MKYLYHFLFVLFTFSAFNAISQDRFSSDFEPIRKDLTSWDPIRGAWLASSLEAMSKNQPIPDRTFPEDFTPVEMLKIAPASSRDNIAFVVKNKRQNSERDTTNQREWDRLGRVVNVPGCKPVSGRSYGDPHLVSFDNESYSFQTVGEFVLARSQSGNFEIQTRQKPQSESFSLNTAAAMNVAGDRVCIYAEDHPMNRRDHPVQVNGAIIQLSNSTYYLPHGGTIRPTGNSYLISWPTGETANVAIGRSGAMQFLNVTVNVYPCANNYSGLLGNANGRGSDDFETSGARMPPMMAFSTFGNSQLQRGSNTAEKEYLAFLARDFARQWRITQETSLFDYNLGQNTLSFTDERFPRVHHTVGDLQPDRREAARINCEQAGVPAAEMGGCIFDQAYISLPPNPRPVIKDPTENFKPAPLERAIRNVNPEPQPLKPIDGPAIKEGKNSIHPDLLNGEQEVKPKSPKTPTETKEVKPTDPVNSSNPKPEEKVKPKPVELPKPSKPSTPAPKPSTPKPAAPKPAAPTIKGKG
jgi:hypothetical protein